MLKDWKWKGSQCYKVDRKKNSRFCKKALRQVYTQFSHHLWKEIATTWYSDNYNNNVWWTITFTFCFIYFSSIFCLSLKFNNFHIILHSAFPNWFNQHLQLISLFTVEYCGSLPLCFCGGVELLCRPNQRCLTYQQRILIAVICSMKTAIISWNVKQFSMGTRHWYIAYLRII